MKQLKKGDPCRVRLNTGEVVEAVYDTQNEYLGKGNHNLISQQFGQLIALGKGHLRHRYSLDDFCSHECRFVGNPCDLIPVGVSNAT